MKPFAESYVDPRQGTYICYRSGINAYEEAFDEGIYCAAGWMSSTYTPQQSIYPRVPRMDHRRFVRYSAFQLTVDGQELFSHWSYVSYESTEEANGLHVKVKLHHALAQIDLTVHTLLDGTSILTRWLEITNLTDKTRLISELAILSGGLQVTPSPELQIKDGENLYRVGYMQGSNWGTEGAFQWHEITGDGYVVSGRYARDRFRHPMFVLENRASGQNFICQIGYSGGWRCEFDYNLDINSHSLADGLMDIAIKLDGIAPLAHIEPGATILTPKVHVGMTCGDLDDALFAMHEHIRASVITHKGEWNAPFEVGIGGETNMDIDGVMASIDYAVKYGADIFFIDHLWEVSVDPNNTPYDWIPPKERYEMGIDKIRDYCHDKGLKFGLWMEPERVFSTLAPLLKAIPDACSNNYRMPIGAAVTPQGPYPLALDREEVAEYVFNMIDELISHYKLDFFRLDHNAYDRSYKTVDGGIVYSDFDYYVNFYRIMERLREKHPSCIFENCASGGGRTDLGVMEHMDHTWITDWQKAPRSFAMTNGLTMALPPEYIDRLIGGQDAHPYGSFAFQSFQLLFGRPTVCAPTVNHYAENATQEELFTRVISVYKNVIQPEAGATRMYHHTPVFDVREPKGTGIIERAHTDGRFSILGIFNLADAGVFHDRVCMRGVDVSRTYEVTFLSTGRTATVSGFVLANEGLLIRLPGACNGEAIVAVAI